MDLTEKKIAQLKSDFLEEYFAPLEAAIDTCESPIEALMLWALILASPGWGSSGYTSAGDLPTARLFPGADDNHACTSYIALGEHLWLFPQADVVTQGGRYRIDIGICMSGEDGEGGREEVYVDVECDGHDFHERTKEQAERDKARDRHLQATGWSVARFTGSQIFREAQATATEAYKLASSLLMRAFEKGQR